MNFQSPSPTPIALLEEPPIGSQSDFGSKTVSGLWWTVGTQVPGQISKFIISVVLARLLAPSDFGLLAMVLVFTGFATLFSDCGFSAALIQREKIDDRHYSSVFWITLAIGIVLAVIVTGSAPIIARFYKEPRLLGIVALSGLTFPLSSLSVVQKAILSRRMNFRLLGIIEIANIVISGVVAIALAFRGFGVWSLVWQSLAYFIVQAVAMGWFTGWKPRLIFDRRAASQLFAYSANLTGFSVVNYWSRNGDNLLVGKFFGSAILGIYSRAFNLMLLPLSQITYVVSRVMFPALSRIQDDTPRVKNIYLRSISIIALLTFPLMLGLLAVADHFILALYGQTWAAVIPTLRIFCILGMMQSVFSTVGWIYQSQGRTDWMFRWEMFSGSLNIGAIIVGILIGSIEAIAISLVVAGFILAPLAIGIPGRLIGVTLSDVVRTVWTALACASAMAIVVLGVGKALPSTMPQAAYLAIQIPVGMAFYWLLLHLFKVSSYKECWSMMGLSAAKLQA